MIPTYKFQKYYYPVRLIYKALSLRDSINTKPIILVYQMAKVGSSTIVASIKKAKLDIPVYHIHALTKEGLQNEERAYFGPSISLTCKSLLPEATHLYEGYYLNDVLKKGNRPSMIVTLVRDPIARNISAFFEGMHLRIPDFNNRASKNDIHVDEIIKLFLDSIKINPDYHMTPLGWFDKEFRKAIKIDVYSDDFPKSKGYKIYGSDNSSVLLLKLEKLNQCFSEASSIFFEKGSISIESKNISRKKIYHDLYKAFKKSIILPESYLQLMYDSKYAKHFYSNDEINSFLERWRN